MDLKKNTGKLIRQLNKLSFLWRIRYRGIRIAKGAYLDIQGAFSYQRKCIVDRNVVIRVPNLGHLQLGTECYLGRYVELGVNRKIEIGNHTSIQDRCVILGDVSIGEYCLFACNVYISSGKHYFDIKPGWLIKDQDRFVLSDPQLAASHNKPVHIEDDCWIGINTVIMQGLTIGKGSVIGANSVVTGDVEPYSIVAGAPARLIRKRLDFTPPQKISHTNPDDLPYFYAGFKVTQQALAVAAKHGGIEAGRQFTLMLGTSAATALHLMLKGMGQKPAQLIFNDNQTLDIPQEMMEIVFKLDKPLNNKLCFRVVTAELNLSLLIQSAWVE